MNETVLVIKDAAVGYRQGRVLKPVACGINASLHAGELVALVGRNGAGKSTLLRTLSAVQKPLSGVMVCKGQSIAEMSHADVAKCISVVLTDNSFPGITVRELVSLGRTPYTNFLGHLTLNDRYMVDKAMARMGIVTLSERVTDTLSDGELQKCMIAKALAQDTPLMLLDEPTAFLDFGSKVALLRMLRDLTRETGKAVLVSTHDMELALRLADRMWVMLDGELNDGTVDELSDNGVLQRFIGGAGIIYDKKEKRIDII